VEQLQILAILALTIAFSHWLGQRRGGRVFGGALLVIICSAILANAGVVPLATADVPVYNQLLGTAAPISIFLLLLSARLDALYRLGRPLAMMFGIAALGTVIGVVVAGSVLNAKEWMGDWHGPLSGMFAATYIGGGANFNALAFHYGFMQSGNLYAASMVADHILTVVWIGLLLLSPKLLASILPNRDVVGTSFGEECKQQVADERLGLGDVVWLLALGIGAFVVSGILAQWLASWLGVQIPSILILTTLALVLAQTKFVSQLKGADVLGMYGAYLFLAALGAYCELAALRETGMMGLLLLAFVVIVLLVHGLIVTVCGRWMRQSPEVVALASATTIGGATVVLPLVERFGRKDLLLPGVVLGSLGNLAGTYIGFALASIIGS